MNLVDVCNINFMTKQLSSINQIDTDDLSLCDNADCFITNKAALAYFLLNYLIYVNLSICKVTDLYLSAFHLPDSSSNTTALPSSSKMKAFPC